MNGWQNRHGMKILQTGTASLILMAYGWYLGQLHQSGYDVAGIFLFITGVAGFVLALIVRYFTLKYSWNNTWIVNILTGIISCGIIFGLILIFVRIHG